MPRIAPSSSAPTHTAREVFVQWLRHEKSRGTPLKPNTRLPALSSILGIRKQLLAAVNNNEDDPLVRMYHVHVALNQCYRDATTAIATIYRSHDEDIKNLHKLVTNVWTIQNDTSEGEGQHTLTLTNYQALKTKASKSVDTSMLKAGHSSAIPFNISRYFELLDQLMLNGKVEHRLHSLTRSLTPGADVLYYVVLCRRNSDI